MMANKADHIMDRKGPGGSIRFRVTVEDVVIFRNAWKKAKSLELTKYTVKKPTKEQVGKLHREIVLGHESMGDGGIVSMKEMASSMVGTGAGSTSDGFHSACEMGHIRDITALAPDEQQELKSDGDTTADQLEGGRKHGPSNGTSGKNTAETAKSIGKKPGWSDRGNEINRAQRVWQQAITKLKADYEILKVQSDDLLQKCLPHESESCFRNTIRLCTSRAAAGSLAGYKRRQAKAGRAHSPSKRSAAGGPPCQGSAGGNCRWRGWGQPA